jgi:hypothetical protein
MREEVSPAAAEAPMAAGGAATEFGICQKAVRKRRKETEHTFPNVYAEGHERLDDKGTSQLATTGGPLRSSCGGGGDDDWLPGGGNWLVGGGRGRRDDWRRCGGRGSEWGLVLGVGTSTRGSRACSSSGRFCV